MSLAVNGSGVCDVCLSGSNVCDVCCPKQHCSVHTVACVCVFSCPVPTESSVSLSTSKKETLEMVEKPLQPPAIKQHGIKGYNNAWTMDICWYRH